MSDVQFEEEETMLNQTGYARSAGPKGLVKIIIGLGLAKNETGANYVLIGIMMVSLIATMFVISRYLI